MEVVANNYLPGDQRLVDKIVYELKAQGIFDQFRKECFADVDTKPAYQNLRQRVEGSVSGFLREQSWRPDINKNQVREMLRKTITELGFLETGVERIVDQVVNPKINTVFLPKVEEVVYNYLGIKKPSRSESSKSDHIDLLPNDLEAVSPESEPADRKDDKSSDNLQDMDESKTEEEESPPFEPLDEQSVYVPHEENSVDSHLSGFSGLISHESNQSNENKVTPMEQDSQMSRNSSDSRLSIVTSDENSKMDVCEDSQSKSIKSNDSSHNKPENNEKGDKSKQKGSDKHKSRSESRSEKSDRDRKSSKDSKSRHSSSSKDKDRSHDRRDSKSNSSGNNTKNDKGRDDKTKDKNEKDRNKSSSSSSSKHGSSGSSSNSGNINKDKNIKKEPSTSDKHKSDKDKGRSSSSSSSNNHKDSKGKDKCSDPKLKDKSSSSDKHKHSSSSSSSLHSDRHKKDKDKKKDNKSKDDHYSSKDKKNDRRSTDRDSNDGQSSKQNFSSGGSETQQSSQTQKSSQETSRGGGESGNSDHSENMTKSPVIITGSVKNSEGTLSSSETQRVKVLKPKCASNIQEALRLMKIRKQLAKLEKQNQLSLATVNVNSSLLLSSSIDLDNLKENGFEKEKVIRENANNKIKSELEVVPSPLQNTVISQDNWDAMEAKLREEVYSEFKEYSDDSFDDNTGDESQISEEMIVNKDDMSDEEENIEACKYFEPVDIKDVDFLRFVEQFIKKVETYKKPRKAKVFKRKVEDTDVKNNNKKLRTTLTTTRKRNKEKFNSNTDIAHNEKFPLPLSPAESEKSVGKKDETILTPLKPKRNSISKMNNQRYSSDDLYKPRPTFINSRRRGAKNLDN